MLKNCLMFFASSFAKSVLTANFYRALELYKKTEKIRRKIPRKVVKRIKEKKTKKGLFN